MQLFIFGLDAEGTVFGPSLRVFAEKKAASLRLAKAKTPLPRQRGFVFFES